MNRTKKLVISLLLLALGACEAKDRSSLVIRGRAAPDSIEDGGVCKYSGEGEFLMGMGRLDVGPDYSGNLRYRLVVYVRNELRDPTLSSSATVRSGKTWTAEAARIRVNPGEYVGDYNPTQLLQVAAPAISVPLDGQSYDVEEQGAQAVLAIPQDLGLMIQQAAAMTLVPGEVRQIVLGITLQGHTMDGLSLDTEEWFYPIEVCIGCLGSPVCPAGTVASFSCGGPGQDAPVTCTAAAGAGG